jgi:hypothetical protein
MAFRDVVLEYSMKIGAATKAPDYLFRAGGAPKFFVEAKSQPLLSRKVPALRFSSDVAHGRLQ